MIRCVWDSVCICLPFSLTFKRKRKTNYQDCLKQNINTKGKKRNKQYYLLNLICVCVGWGCIPKKQ